MEEKIHKIDCAGESLGRIAAKAAVLLRGKQKPGFVRNIDQGGMVEIYNADKMKFTGKKLRQKIYYKHSGYLGGLRAESLGDKYKKNAAWLVRRAVYGMLPKNRTRHKIIKRLIIK